MARAKKRKSHRAFWTFFWIQFAVFFILVGFVGYYYIAGYSSEVKELHRQALEIARQSNPSDFRTAQTSVCYDVNGNVISTLKGEKDVYYLTYDNIPILVQNAIVSTEDKQFFNHKGYDVKGIVRAIWAMYRNKEVTQGGSTITQQLAKTIYLTPDRTWQRKVQEIYLAVELERKYTKSQILEYYINNVYFANGYYGICAASQGYFQKSPDELTLSEAAFLCAIPNSPATYDPLVHKENTLDRRDFILGEMLEEEKITIVSYQMAKDEEINIKRQKLEKQNYFETYTYYCATRLLMEKDGFVLRSAFSGKKDRKKYDEAYQEAYNEAQAKLFSGGYRIYTSLDPNIQKELQRSVDESLSEFDEVNDEGVYALQSAAVCIDNTSGLVKAIVGGRSQDFEGYTLNRGFQAFRQPGSSIKPLIVYTPALERGYTPETKVVDKKEEEDDGPLNDDNVYAGEVDLRTAVKYSKNTVAWNVFKTITPSVGLGYILDMEFSKIDNDDYRLPSALGGFTTGVSPVEMASGFATLENDGVFRRPTCITKITNAAGDKVIYEHSDEGKQVYEVTSSRQMTDMLVSVMSEGTGKDIALENMPCAGKTGTTNSNKDGWFVGYTRYFTTAVWVGYDLPREMENLKGATYPGTIWKDFMEKLHHGLPYIDFKKPFSNDYEALPKNYLTDTYDIEEQYIETAPPLTPIDEPVNETPMEQIPLD